MRIQRASDVPVKTTPEGDERHYHVFEEFEIIEFTVPPHYEQPRHRHKQTWEGILITEGEVVAIEGEKEETVSEGDTVVFTPAPEYHTLANRTDEPAQGICFKLHPSPQSTHSLFANDKEVPPQAKD